MHPSWLYVFIKILKYITGIWKCSFHLFWDYPCGCHHCPFKHDICIWVTSDTFWSGGMIVHHQDHKVKGSNISSFILSRMNDFGVNDFVVLMLESVALSCFLRIPTEVANYTHLALSM
jgi:hypothetical protein